MATKRDRGERRGPGFFRPDRAAAYIEVAPRFGRTATDTGIRNPQGYIALRFDGGDMGAVAEEVDRVTGKLKP